MVYTKILQLTLTGLSRKTNFLKQPELTMTHSLALEMQIFMKYVKPDFSKLPFQYGDLCGTLWYLLTFFSVSLYILQILFKRFIMLFQFIFILKAKIYE